MSVLWGTDLGTEASKVQGFRLISLIVQGAGGAPIEMFSAIIEREGPHSALCAHADAPPQQLLNT